jgi:hypothetical protein
LERRFHQKTAIKRHLCRLRHCRRPIEHPHGVVEDEKAQILRTAKAAQDAQRSENVALSGRAAETVRPPAPMELVWAVEAKVSR